MWNWWKRKGPERDLDELAIDTLMQRQCNLEECLPVLEKAGLSRKAISAIYNLTVIACARGFVERMLSPEQLPEHYVLETADGDREVRFADCAIYQRARRMIKNYGEADVIVATFSGQVQSLNWALNQLDADVKQQIGRIRLLPPRIPRYGPADFRASILPAQT
jgi:hypothetical protein